MGGRLFETINQQQDVYGLTKGQSKGEAMRPLRSPEQLMIEFAKEKMLVLPQGSTPLSLNACPTSTIQPLPVCGTIRVKAGGS